MFDASTTRRLAGVTKEQWIRQVKATLARKSLYEFVKQAWPVHNPGHPLIENWHLYVCCRHLEMVTQGRIRKLLVNISPGFAKSLVFSVYWPSWEWLQKPSLQYMAVSAIKNVVLRDARRHRELVESPWYQRTFLPRWGFSGSQDAKGYFVNTCEGHRISLTTGQHVTGARGDRTIIDDPHDARYALISPTRYDRDNEWLDSVLSTRKNGPLDPTVVVMQRLSGNDYTAKCLRGQGWTVLVIPNEWDGKDHAIEVTGYRDPRKIEGEFLCPALVDSVRKAELMEDLTEIGYLGQFQQMPIPPGGVIFDNTTFQYYGSHELPKFEFIFASWDTSFKEEKDADFVVGQLWGVIGSSVYLLEQFRHRVEFWGCLEAIRKQRQHALQVYGRAPSPVLIEDTANGPSVIATIRREIPGVLAVHPGSDSKQARARACQPLFQAHNVYFPARYLKPWMVDFLIELEHFPRWSADDQVDATTQALNWFASHDRGFYVGRL